MMRMDDGDVIVPDISVYIEHSFHRICNIHLLTVNTEIPQFNVFFGIVAWRVQKMHVHARLPEISRRQARIHFSPAQMPGSIVDYQYILFHYVR